MQRRKTHFIRSAFSLVVVVLGCSGNAEAPSSTTSKSSDGGGALPVVGSAGDTAPVSTNAHTSGQSLVWLWHDYASSLDAIVAHPSSFTHVSPAFYQMNYAYGSGVPAYWNQTSDSFDGLSSSEICKKVHAAGMKCVPLIFAGGGNGGTDVGIHDVLDDSPAGARDALVTSLVNEAVAKGYDGYNLDWEFDGTTTRATYGAKLDDFLETLKNALHAHQMELSFDLGTWFIQQTSCSHGTGVVDLTTFGAHVDTAIVEDYTSVLGAPKSSCPTSLPNPAPCTGDFASVLDLMCVYLPSEKISIGVDARPDTFLANNPIAGAAVAATKAYGIKNVAIWPDSNADGPNGTYAFMDAKAIQPANANWYDLLSAFLH